MYGLYCSPIAGHEACPDLISGIIKLHKWDVVPVAMKIGTCYLLVKKVVDIMYDKDKVFCHPPWQVVSWWPLIIKSNHLLGIVALPNLIDCFVHLIHRSPGYIIEAIFGWLCCPELQGLIDPCSWSLLLGKMIVGKLKREPIFKQVKWVVRYHIQGLMNWRGSYDDM